MKSQVLHTVILYFCWGCREKLKLIAFGSERVNVTISGAGGWERKGVSGGVGGGRKVHPFSVVMDKICGSPELLLFFYVIVVFVVVVVIVVVVVVVVRFPVSPGVCHFSLAAVWPRFALHRDGLETGKRPRSWYEPKILLWGTGEGGGDGRKPSTWHLTSSHSEMNWQGSFHLTWE